MKVLLVEPYFTGSHAAWAEGYAASSSHDVGLVTLEGRFWRWRMLGSHIDLAGKAAAWVDGNGRPDALLATSMANLPAFLAHTRRTLRDVPVAVYMHENQLTYHEQPSPDVAYAIINWSSMTAADLVIFNSEFHRSSWFGAAHRWLGSYPDHRHDAQLRAVETASQVIPVGVDLRRLVGERTSSVPPLILWNHRADRDKAPEVFVDALLELAHRGADFRVAVAGERFVDSGDVFAPLSAMIGERVVHDGHADDASYLQLLRSADIVVSTALQEFYGVSITEAVYAGAFPLLPDRLVYPERIPRRFHDRCLYRRGTLVDSLLWALDHADERTEIAAALRPHMAESDWANVAPRLDGALSEIPAG